MKRGAEIPNNSLDRQATAMTVNSALSQIKNIPLTEANGNGLASNEPSIKAELEEPDQSAKLDGQQSQNNDDLCAKSNEAPPVVLQ